MDSLREELKRNKNMMAFLSDALNKQVETVPDKSALETIFSLCRFKEIPRLHPHLHQSYYLFAMSYYAEKLGLKESCEKAGFSTSNINQILRTTNKHLSSSLSDPETSEIVGKIVFGGEFDQNRATEIAQVCEYWRLFTRQMFFLNNDLELPFNRPLTETEFNTLVSGVGLKNETHVSFLIDSWGIGMKRAWSPEELKKKYPDMTEKDLPRNSTRILRGKDDTPGWVARGIVAKELLTSFLTLEPYIPPNPDLRVTRVGLLQIISDAVGFEITRRPTHENFNENLSLLIDSMEMKANHSQANKLLFGADDGIEKPINEVADIMGSGSTMVQVGARERFIKNLATLEYKNLLIEALAGNSIRQYISETQIDKEARRRESPHQMTVLKNIMGDRDDLRTLTFGEWQHMLTSKYDLEMEPKLKKFHYFYCGIGKKEHTRTEAAVAMGLDAEEGVALDKSLRQWMKLNKLKLEAKISDYYYATRKKTPEEMEERNRLIVENQGLVDTIAAKHAKKMAFKYPDYQQAYEEYHSIAQIGMIKAADRFNPNKGFKFSTIACRIMDNECNEHIKHNYNEIQASSLDDVAFEGEDDSGKTHADSIADESANVEEMVVAGETSSILKNTIENTLVEREAKIIKYRFPQDGSEPKTQQEIADLWGLSQPQVARIEKAALAKLRNSLSKQQLR